MIQVLLGIRFDHQPEHWLRKLRDKTLYRRLRDAIEELRHNPHPSGCKKLSGQPGYRIRVGNYRIIYRIENHELVVVIVQIGHRKDIYR